MPLPRVGDSTFVVQAFSSIPLSGAENAVAEACAGAARQLFGHACLRIPASPVVLEVGDSRDGLELAFRFPIGDSEGELWVPRAALQDRSVREAAAEQLTRIWQVQGELAARARELDRVRFQLAAIQQVTRTLAVVREVEETERLALDSIREVFFAWWAVLYRLDGDQYTFRAARSLGEFTETAPVPVEVARGLGSSAETPQVLEAGLELGGCLPADAAVIASLDLQESGSALLVLGPRMNGAAYDEPDLALLQALVDTSAIALRNAELVDRLRMQATRDRLTGCYNRRGFDEHLEVEFARARRYDRELSLLLLDMDHFKEVNDRFGHDAGDRVLQRIGEVLRSTFRVTDIPCRYGGEEFALIFPETPKTEAARLAEMLRSAVEALPVTDGVPCPLTASVGVASFPWDAEDPAGLLRAADRALYRAKREGRNRVRVA